MKKTTIRLGADHIVEGDSLLLTKAVLAWDGLCNRFVLVGSIGHAVYIEAGSSGGMAVDFDGLIAQLRPGSMRKLAPLEQLAEQAE